MNDEMFEEMFDRARKLCTTVQALVNEDETPSLALVLALRMLEAGYASQVDEWEDINEMLQELKLVPKFKKGEMT